MQIPEHLYTCSKCGAPVKVTISPDIRIDPEPTIERSCEHTDHKVFANMSAVLVGVGGLKTGGRKVG